MINFRKKLGECIDKKIEEQALSNVDWVNEEKYKSELMQMSSSAIQELLYYMTIALLQDTLSIDEKLLINIKCNLCSQELHKRCTWSPKIIELKVSSDRTVSIYDYVYK